MPLDARKLTDAAHVGAGLAAVQPVRWRWHWRLDKRWGDWTDADILAGRAPAPYESIDIDGNLLTTAGATAIWNGLVTAGLATPFNSTNAMLAVGDSTTAEAAGQTDLQAATGTKLNAADPTSATNATPIVINGTFSPVPAVGSVVVCAGFSGAGASAINGTFEVQAASGSAITLLNSAGSGAITVTGATVSPINKYRQLVSGAPTVSTNQVSFVAAFPAANANFAWQEFAVTTGGAATNKQATPPPTMLNRKVTSLGTKTSAGTWTLTGTCTLS